MAKILINPEITMSANDVPIGRAELELEDESKLRIGAAPFRVSVYKKRSWLSDKLVWEFGVPLSILNPHLPMTVAEELLDHKTQTELLLDVVLDSIKDCSTIDEATARLNQKTTPLLNDYVEQKKLETHLTWDEINNIIGDFGEVLANYTTPLPIIYPISWLPHPKGKIEYALKAALKTHEIAEKNLAVLTGFHTGRWTPEEIERYERPWSPNDFELEAKKIDTYTNEDEQAKAFLIIEKHLKDYASMGLVFLNYFVPDDEFVSRTNEFLKLFRK